MKIRISKECVVGVGTSTIYWLPFGRWLIITRP